MHFIFAPTLGSLMKLEPFSHACANNSVFAFVFLLAALSLLDQEIERWDKLNEVKLSSDFCGGS